MNAGTQYDGTKDDSTQTINPPDAETLISILELANMFLHCSYWMLMLSIALTRLDLSGLAWSAKQKDIVCREAATTIFAWILSKGGKVELADIAKPDFDDENQSAEYVLQKWDQLDKWLETKMEKILLAVEEGDTTGLKDMMIGLMETFKRGYLVH